MRLTTQLGVGIISLFLFGAGCQTEPVKPPEKPKVEHQQEEKEQPKIQKQTKSAYSRESVYLNDHETAELTSIKKKPIIYNGSIHSKKVALTFDDGPDLYVTKQILDILAKEQVHATFFVTGNMVKEHPEMLKRIYEQGHVIGNHTWSHPQLTTLSISQLDQEIRQTDKLIEKVIGKKVQLVRPPYGATNSKVQNHLKKNGYLLINWNVDTNDWRGHSGQKIEQIVKSQLTNGSIILQHNAGDKLQGTVDALPNIIKFLKEQKYQLVTVDQLLDVAPYREPEQQKK